MAIQWLLVILLTLAASMTVPSSGKKSNAILLDTEGHPLQAGQNYFILAAGEGKGRGLGLSNTCPQYVVEDKCGEGLPVVFHPICPENNSLFQRSMAVHFAMSAPYSICQNKTGANAWSIGSVSGMNQSLVQITSGEGGSFQIFKIGDDEYEIFWCPAVLCERRFGIGPVCSALGIHGEKQGNDWIVLAVSGVQRLRVQFKRAPAKVKV